MPQDPPPGQARVTPMLATRTQPRHWSGWREASDSRNAHEFGRLTRVVGHAEMESDGGGIALAQPTPSYQSLKHHREKCETARTWQEVPFVIDGMMVYVDAYCERAPPLSRVS